LEFQDFDDDTQKEIIQAEYDSANWKWNERLSKTQYCSV
jgi:hypothetical protein